MNEQQVGGNHYERLEVEPVRVMAAFNFNWFQGEILKYVSRFPFKNGEQDLNKAIHISQMAKDLKVGEKKKKCIKFAKLVYEKKYLLDLVEDYRKQFEYEEYMTVILIGLIEENYLYVKEQTVKLKEKYYGKEEGTTGGRK
jgi:hypothetical protein